MKHKIKLGDLDGYKIREPLARATEKLTAGETKTLWLYYDLHLERAEYEVTHNSKPIHRGGILDDAVEAYNNI